jgi:hypothetical protein
MVGVHHLVVAEQHGPFDDVGQLAHVAGPGVARQHVERAGRDPAGALAVVAGELGQEIVGQQRNVGLTVAQVRHHDREAAQAVEQVGAESVVRDRAFEARFRGGDYPAPAG